MNDKIPSCTFCAGAVKPNVVFFGEDLPETYFQHAQDFPKADLLMIMGTSLKVRLTMSALVVYKSKIKNLDYKGSFIIMIKLLLCFIRLSHLPA